MTQVSRTWKKILGWETTDFPSYNTFIFLFVMWNVSVSHYLKIERALGSGKVGIWGWGGKASDTGCDARASSSARVLVVLDQEEDLGDNNCLRPQGHAGLGLTSEWGSPLLWPTLPWIRSLYPEGEGSHPVSITGHLPGGQDCNHIWTPLCHTWGYWRNGNK